MTGKEMCDSCVFIRCCSTVYAKDYWCGNHMTEADREYWSRGIQERRKNEKK